jgi:hypothetical protein
MPTPKAVITALREWLVKAENDLQENGVASKENGVASIIPGPKAGNY